MVHKSDTVSDLLVCANGEACLHPRGPALPRTEFYWYKTTGYYSNICKSCKKAKTLSDYHKKREGKPRRGAYKRIVVTVDSRRVTIKAGKTAKTWALADLKVLNSREAVVKAYCGLGYQVVRMSEAGVVTLERKSLT